MSAATPAAARTSFICGRLPRLLALLAAGVVMTTSLVPPAMAAETTGPTETTGTTAATAATEDVRTATEQVAQLGAEVEAAAAEYASVQARLVAQQNRVAAADARAASQATLVRLLEEQVVALAVQTYKSGSVDPQLSLLATGRIEAVSSTTLLGMLTARRAVTLKDVRSAEGELQQLQGTARTELEAVQALQADLTQRRADIEARLAGAKDVLAVAEAEAQRQILLEEARRAAVASRGRSGVDDGSRRSGSLADLVLSPVGSGLLATPTPGRQAAYGWRIHPVYGIRKFHSGMDIITGCGTPVVAATDGVVESAAWEGSYGNIIVLRHGESSSGQMSTAYAHLDEFVVTSGPVSRGQVIGYVGTTGLSTGCHLHFEVRIDGEDVDPARFI